MSVKQRPLLYIETSVFGFYYDEEPRNALRREAVRTMFQQISLGMLDAAASPLTEEELDASAEPCVQSSFRFSTNLQCWTQKTRKSRGSQGCTSRTA
jgi:hypothetical protein